MSHIEPMEHAPDAVLAKVTDVLRRTQEQLADIFALDEFEMTLRLPLEAWQQVSGHDGVRRAVGGPSGVIIIEEDA